MKNKPIVKNPFTFNIESKIKKIIKSCTTIKHWLVAESAVQLCYENFDVDPEIKQMFDHILKTKKIESDYEI